MAIGHGLLFCLSQQLAGGYSKVVSKHLNLCDRGGASLFDIVHKITAGATLLASDGGRYPFCFAENFYVLHKIFDIQGTPLHLKKNYKKHKIMSDVLTDINLGFMILPAVNQMATEHGRRCSRVENMEAPITEKLVCAEKGCALLAAISTGLLPKSGEGWNVELFERFWAQYTASRDEMRRQEITYLTEVFHRESEKRAQQRANDRRYYLRVAVTAILASIFGSCLVLLLESFLVL